MLHYLFLDFSPLITENNLDHGYDLYQKKTAKFVSECYKICINVFSIKPLMTQAQFLSTGFAERKSLFVSDVTQKVRALHASLKKQKQQEARPKWTGFSSNRALYPGLRSEPEEHVAPAIKVERGPRRTKKTKACDDPQDVLPPQREDDWFVHAASSRGVDTHTQESFQVDMHLDTHQPYQTQLDNLDQEKTLETPLPQCSPPAPLARSPCSQKETTDGTFRGSSDEGSDGGSTTALRLDKMEKSFEMMFLQMSDTVSAKFDLLERRMIAMEERQTNIERCLEQSQKTEEGGCQHVLGGHRSQSKQPKQAMDPQLGNGMDEDEFSFVVLGNAKRTVLPVNSTSLSVNSTHNSDSIPQQLATHIHTSEPKVLEVRMLGFP
jgi:hypothetical protein